MKFFHAPGSCSVGIRVLLEEAGVAYDLVALDFAKGDQRKPEYLAVNPKGKVPALLLDNGTLVTEFPAIAWWIARNYPEAGLLPEGVAGEVAALELLDYVVSSLHMRGFTLIVRPSRFTTSAEAQAEVAAHGREVYAAGLGVLSQKLGEADYMLGRFSIADAAVFYLLSWIRVVGVELPANLASYMARMRARPAVARALA